MRLRRPGGELPIHQGTSAAEARLEDFVLRCDGQVCESGSVLAVSLGLPAPKAVRAGQPSVSRQAAGWRRSATATVVAVEVPAAGPGCAAAGQLLRALAPTYTVGVVAATTDTADVHRWTDRLGGVDAIAVHGVDATEDPWRLLSAGIPVAMVDDMPATPAV